MLLIKASFFTFMPVHVVKATRCDTGLQRCSGVELIGRERRIWGVFLKVNVMGLGKSR